MIEKKILLILSFCFLIFTTGCGGNSVTLSDVHSNLDISDRVWADLSDDGSFIEVTVTWNCPPDDEDILCNRSNAVNSILEELGFGQNVRQRMNSTRALDGRQFAENENFQVSWTFHPDDGLQVLFEDR